MHIGDDAELYALGVLGDAERIALDAHLAQCGECRRRVGEAEETLLEMDRHVALQDPPADLAERLRAGRRPRAVSSGFSWYALAAAFLIGLLPSTWFVTSTMQTKRSESLHSAALLAMVRSHFAHAQFTAAPGGPDAKVIFARNGSWLYIIVAEKKAYHVVLEPVLRSHEIVDDVGTTRLYGDGSELFVASPPRATAVELVNDAGATVARASILNPNR